MEIQPVSFKLHEIDLFTASFRSNFDHQVFPSHPDTMRSVCSLPKSVWHMPHSTTTELGSVCATSLLAYSKTITGGTASRVGSVSEPPRRRRPRREKQRATDRGVRSAQSPAQGSGRAHGSSRRPPFRTKCPPLHGFRLRSIRPFPAHKATVHSSLRRTRGPVGVHRRRPPIASLPIGPLPLHWSPA